AAVSTWPERPLPASACRTSTASHAPHSRVPSEGLGITRHRREFMYFTRPGIPVPVTPGWNGRPGAVPCASHHSVTGSARPGRGRVIRTRTRDYTYGFITRLSYRSVHSNSCNFVSHDRPPSARGPVGPRLVRGARGWSASPRSARPRGRSSSGGGGP